MTEDLRKFPSNVGRGVASIDLALGDKEWIGKTVYDLAVKERAAIHLGD